MEKLKAAAHERNPRAAVVVTDSKVTVEDPSLIEGKKAVTVDDGPTLTHGGMAFGAGDTADSHPFYSQVYRGAEKGNREKHISGKVNVGGRESSIACSLETVQFTSCLDNKENYWQKLI